MQLSKRQRTDPQEEVDLNSYSQKLAKLSDLRNKLENLGNDKFNEDDIKVYSRSTENSIPRIVVLGDQSSGKSLTLKRLFDINVISRPGIGTRCPIEFRLGPSFDNKCWCESMDGAKSEILPFDNQNIQRIYDSIDKETENRNNVLYEGRIIIEYFNNMSVVIIDLPGLNENININDYIMPYLQGEQTLILHICKSDEDSANIKSRQLINEVDPRYTRTVQIFTNLDHTLNDDSRKNNMLNQLSQNMPNFLLINNFGNKELLSIEDKETEKNVLNDYLKIGNVRLGIDELNNYILETLNERVKIMFPEIKKLAKELLTCISEKLHFIGFKKPDMREEKARFITLVNTKTRNYFENNSSPLNRELVQILEEFSPNRIYNIISNISVKLDFNNLALQLRMNNGLNLDNTNGYLGIISQLISELNSYLEQDLSQLMIRLSNIYGNVFNNIFDENLYPPSSYDCCSKRKGIMMKELDVVLDSTFKELKNYLEATSRHPYCSNKEYIIDMYYESLVPILDDFITCHKHPENNEQNIKNIIRNIGVDNLEARRVKFQLDKFWERFSYEFIDRLQEEICRRINRELQEKIIFQCNQLEASDFSESEEIEKNRERLMEVYNLIEGIL